MCGRYSLFFDDEYDYDIAKMMDILKQHYPQTEIKQGEIYPTNTAPVLVKQNSEIAPVPYSWGFPNFRNKGVIINARAETAEEKKTFKDSLLNRRCVILKDKYIILLSVIYIFYFLLNFPMSQ